MRSVSQLSWLAIGLAAPARVGDANDWKAVAAGEEHTCALKASGALYCWGRNADRELGMPGAGQDCDGDACLPSPTQLGSDTDWSFVTAAGQSSFAIRGSGALYCWGSSCEAQMQCASADCQGKPIRIGSADDWVSASTWASHSCAIKRDGSLWCWAGLRGTGATGMTPERIDPGSPVAQVATGEAHTCAVTGDGRLLCAGLDRVGQIGVDPASLPACGNDGPCRSEPAPVDPETQYGAVVAGYFHTCALRKSDASVWCFGVDTGGQLGRPSDATCREGDVVESCSAAPVSVALPL